MLREELPLIEKTLIRWSGYALILWAMHWLIRDYTFAFTHGTTEDAMDATILGIEGKQFGVLWSAFAPLGLVGLAGLYLQASPRLGRLGRAGFLVAGLGAAMWFASSAMQYWLADIERDFYTPMVYNGWLLSILSVFVLTAGLIAAGIDVQRARALPRGTSLILVIGILTLPEVLAVSYLVGHSENSLFSKLLYGAITVPSDLCWLRLGILSVAAAPVRALSPK